MTLELPPLRSYKDNLEVLANVFLEQSAARHGKPAPRLGPDVLARLAAYDFPGNVRELKNTIEHAVILCTGDELRVEDLPRPLQDRAPRRVAREDRPAAADARRRARDAGSRRSSASTSPTCSRGTRGNVKVAAKAAGINTVTLYRLLKRRGLHLGRTVKQG